MSAGERVALVVELPEGDAQGYGNVVKFIGQQIDAGETSGTIPGGEAGPVTWSLVEVDEAPR